MLAFLSIKWIKCMGFYLLCQKEEGQSCPLLFLSNTYTQGRLIRSKIERISNDPQHRLSLFPNPYQWSRQVMRTDLSHALTVFYLLTDQPLRICWSIQIKIKITKEIKWISFFNRSQMLFARKSKEREYHKVRPCVFVVFSYLKNSIKT